MGLPELNIFEGASPQDLPLRARAVESLRTALQLAPSSTEGRLNPVNPDGQRGSPNKPTDIGLAMGLAREAIATAAKAAHDELARMRELLETADVRARAAEERARAAEERAQAAEERARAAEAQGAEAELLLADIRDQIVSKVTPRRAA
jgi:hypothetical protein